MKKLLTILLALLICTSLVLIGCSKKDNGTDPVKDPADELTDEPVEFPEDILAYNTQAENLVAELQAKSELDEEILGYINGMPISASQVRYAAMYTGYNEEMGVTGEELENVAPDYFKQNAAVIALAYEYGVDLGSTTKDYMTTSIQAMKEYFVTDEAYNEYFAGNPYTAFTYHLATLYNFLFEQVYAEFSEDEAVKSEAIANAIAFYEENDFVRAKHILIQFPAGEGENGELTDEQKAATLEKANEVLDKVNAMGDISEFDALITEYNEDPGMTSNPDGYFFGRGEMVPEFEESAYSLEEGKTSGLVETTYGYHILLKLPVNDEEAIVNTEKFAEFTTEAFYDLFEEKLNAEYDITYVDGYSARFEEYKNEYYETMSESATTAE